MPSTAGTNLLHSDGSDQLDKNGADRLSSGSSDACCCGFGSCVTVFHLTGGGTVAVDSSTGTGRYCVVQENQGLAPPPNFIQLGQLKVTAAGSITLTADASVTNKALVYVNDVPWFTFPGYPTHTATAVKCMSPSEVYVLSGLAIGDIIQIVGASDCSTPLGPTSSGTDTTCVGVCCPVASGGPTVLYADASTVTGIPATGDVAGAGYPLNPVTLNGGDSLYVGENWGFYTPQFKGTFYANIGGKQVVFCGPGWNPTTCRNEIWIFSLVSGVVWNPEGRFLSGGTVSDQTGTYTSDGTYALGGYLTVTM